MAERAGVLRVGDRVLFAGAERSVVALSGSMIRLMADSGEVMVAAMAYLAGGALTSRRDRGRSGRARLRRRGCWSRCPPRSSRRPATGSGT